MAEFARPTLLAIGIALAACGDGDEGGLFGKGSGGASGSGAGGAVSGGSGGAPSGGSAGASGGAPSDGAAGTSGTSASGGGSGGATDAGDGGGTGGSGGSGGTSGVGTGPCGALTCAFSAGDGCCKAEATPLYCSNDALSNPCKCNGILCDALEIKCDGPEDCQSGKICCAERGLTSATWDVVECRETCKSDPIVGSTRREVCHPGGKPCASGASCQGDPGLPAGYATCAQ